MSEHDIGAVVERSKRNAQDIQKLWRISSEQGEQVARMDEKLGALKEGQVEAGEERTRQGQLLDRIAAKVGAKAKPYNHSHGGATPPAPPVVPAVGGALLALPWWAKWAAMAGAAVLVAIAGTAAKLLGLTPPLP